ncbi:MAG: HAD-IIIC family phosphatase, partial [Kiritimatiellia bacterium]|nr:HAD-IIIC family phosphatase [Kiritimatiellia bacterium]
FVATERTKPKKVLLLDCDNTLWGGVVGEDGPDGIQLDADYPGSAFVEIQKQILQLHHQGVVLGVCSKNDEAVVKSLFEDHPNMILKPEHISVWAVNWDPKSENIASIAERLSLSMGSFVFIDDSSFERAEIRARCPDVFVPEVPENPLQLLEFWHRFNPFARTSLSDEDRFRGRTYQQEEQRQTVRVSAMSLTDFYVDLQMRCRMWHAGEKDVARIVQMSQRTNQFNATTVRMNEGDVGALLGDATVAVYLLELIDRFGASGVIGCAVVRRTDRSIEIEQLMLSCRVLKRTVEKHFVGLIMSEVLGSADTLVLRYAQTKKNRLVREFYEQIAPDASNEDQSEWCIPVTSENADNLLQPWIETEIGNA